MSTTTFNYGTTAVPETRAPYQPVGASDLLSAEQLQALLAKDEAAWDRLFQLSIPIITAIARQDFGLHPEDTEDVVQMVHIKLYEHLGSLRDPVSFTSWLRRMTQRTIIDLLRQKRQTVSLEALAEDTATDCAFLADRRAKDAIESAAPRLDVQRAVASLPPLYREPVVQYVMEGKPQNEIAALLGCPRSTVATRIQRGVQQVRQRLGEGYGDELSADSGLPNQSRCAQASDSGGQSRETRAATGQFRHPPVRDVPVPVGAGETFEPDIIGFDLAERQPSQPRLRQRVPALTGTARRKDAFGVRAPAAESAHSDPELLVRASSRAIPTDTPAPEDGRQSPTAPGGCQADTRSEVDSRCALVRDQQPFAMSVPWEHGCPLRGREVPNAADTTAVSVAPVQTVPAEAALGRRRSRSARAGQAPPDPRRVEPERRMYDRAAVCGTGRRTGVDHRLRYGYRGHMGGGLVRHRGIFAGRAPPSITDRERP